MSFCVGIYVARYLGPKDFGLLSYAISLVGLLSAITSFRFDSLVIRDLVRDETRRDTLLGTAFVLRTGGAILTLLITGLILSFLPNDRLTNLLILLIAVAPFFQSFNVIDFYFQSKVLSKYAVWSRFPAGIVSALLRLGLIYVHASLFFFALLVAVEAILMGAGLTVAYRAQRLSLRRWNFEIASARRLLRESWSLVLSAIAMSVYQRLDQIMIKEMLNTGAVGIYAVAVNLSQIWYMVPMIIAGSLFPAIIHARGSNYGVYLKSLQKLYDLFFVLSLAIGVVVSIYSHDIIRLLYGAQFKGSGTILAIHIWSGIFVFQGVIRNQFLVVENQQQLGLWFRVISIMLNVALNVIMIPRYGVVGSALATLISSSLPIYLSSFLHPLLKLNLFMCLKSFIFPVRLIVYGMRIYR